MLYYKLVKKCASVFLPLPSFSPSFFLSLLLHKSENTQCSWSDPKLLSSDTES